MFIPASNATGLIFPWEQLEEHGSVAQQPTKSDVEPSGQAYHWPPEGQVPVNLVSARFDGWRRDIVLLVVDLKEIKGTCN